MRSLLIALAGFVSLGVGLQACDATGTVTGGAALIPDPCAATGNSSDWSALYTCYFGPTGKASCAGQASCHATASGAGALSSGFVCGSTSLECWQSMTQCALVEAGSAADAAEVDATLEAGADGAADSSGSDSAASDAGESEDADDAGASSGGGGTATCSCDGGTPPIAACGTSDPTNTTLWSALRGAGGSSCPTASSPLCMPFGGGYTFTQADLDRISAWIKGGALYGN